MIISASRRTDIPAFYSDWFFRRIKAGYVDVRNPINYHMVSRVSLKPDVVDCIVFWSKNPKPMIEGLDQLESYKYYFQFTLNAYDRLIEKSVPSESERVETFKRLSDKIGSKRVIWRYDPILLSDTIDVQFHLNAFSRLAEELCGYTYRCVISFIDIYKKMGRNIAGTSILAPREGEMRELARGIARIGSSNGMEIESCAEAIDLTNEGVAHGHCIDKDLIESIIDYKIEASKDKNQRLKCGCISSIDIGQYNTCSHGCDYCYANTNHAWTSLQKRRHNPKSTMLIGCLSDDDIVNERKMFSLKDFSLDLW